MPFGRSVSCSFLGCQRLDLGYNGVAFLPQRFRGLYCSHRYGSERTEMTACSGAQQRRPLAAACLSLSSRLKDGLLRHSGVASRQWRSLRYIVKLRKCERGWERFLHCVRAALSHTVSSFTSMNSRYSGLPDTDTTAYRKRFI